MHGEYNVDLQTVYNTSSPVGCHSTFLSGDFLFLPPISESDIVKAIKRLSPYKSVGPNGVPDFIIKGSSTIFAQLLTYMYFLSYPVKGTLQNAVTKVVIVPILKKK
jgi:hypothetical protein